jgi:hypothetical protein
MFLPKYALAAGGNKAITTTIGEMFRGKNLG